MSPGPPTAHNCALCQETSVFSAARACLSSQVLSLCACPAAKYAAHLSTCEVVLHGGGAAGEVKYGLAGEGACFQGAAASKASQDSEGSRAHRPGRWAAPLPGAGLCGVQ